MGQDKQQEETHKMVTIDSHIDNGIPYITESKFIFIEAPASEELRTEIDETTNTSTMHKEIQTVPIKMEDYSKKDINQFVNYGMPLLKEADIVITEEEVVESSYTTAEIIVAKPLKDNVKKQEEKYENINIISYRDDGIPNITDSDITFADVVV